MVEIIFADNREMSMSNDARALLDQARQALYDLTYGDTKNTGWWVPEQRRADKVREQIEAFLRGSTHSETAHTNNALVAQSRAPGSNRGAEGSRSSECTSSVDKPRHGVGFNVIDEYHRLLACEWEKAYGRPCAVPLPNDAEKAALVELCARILSLTPSAVTLPTVIKKAEETMELVNDPEADAMTFWRARARYFAEEILRSTQSASGFTRHRRCQGGCETARKWGTPPCEESCEWMPQKTDAADSPKGNTPTHAILREEPQ